MTNFSLLYPYIDRDLMTGLHREKPTMDKEPSLMFKDTKPESPGFYLYQGYYWTLSEYPACLYRIPNEEFLTAAIMDKRGHIVTHNVDFLSGRWCLLSYHKHTVPLDKEDCPEDLVAKITQNVIVELKKINPDLLKVL